MRADQHQTGELMVYGNLACAPRTATAAPSLGLARERPWPVREKTLVEETLDDFDGTPFSSDEGDQRFAVTVFSIAVAALFFFALVPVF